MSSSQSLFLFSLFVICSEIGHLFPPCCTYWQLLQLLLPAEWITTKYPRKATQKLQLAQCGAVHLPNGARHGVPGTPALHTLPWLPCHFAVTFKVQSWMPCLKLLHWRLSPPPQHHHSRRMLIDQLRMVPSRRLKSGHVLRNLLPLLVWQSPLFCVQGHSRKAIYLARLLPRRVVLGSRYLNSVFLLSSHTVGTLKTC